MEASLRTEAIERACVVYVTARQEVVVFDSVCVAVRDVETGEWLDEHSAVDERVTLDVERSSERLARFQVVAHSFGLRLVLGRVLAVRRPSAQVCGYLSGLSSVGRVAIERLQRTAQDAPARKVA
jgi:hypothetical protein